MVWLYEFSSTRFNPADEPPNPINPFAGYGLLQWLGETLAQTDFNVSLPPEAEDWGWYIIASSPPASYLIGAADQSIDDQGKVEWAIQVYRERSILDKLLGRNKLSANEPILLAIQTILDTTPEIEMVSSYEG